MAQEQINVPNIGDSRDVDVVEVLVKPGTRVDKEQTLIVLESEKASMDVPSPRAGVVKDVAIKVGDKVSEGSPILTLETEEAGQEQKESQPSAAKEEKPEKSSSNGGGAASPAPANDQAAPANDQATRPRDAQPKQGKPPASEAKQPAAEDEPDEEKKQPAEAPKDSGAAQEKQTRTIPPLAAPGPRQSSEPPPRESVPHASPAVRRFARELGVDLKRVDGSAPHGRITKEDVQGFVKGALTNGAAAGGVAALSIADAPEIDFSQFGPIKPQALTKIQRLTGRNLHRSWVTIPHVTQFDEADITELEEFRKKTRSENPELKLTLVTFFMKALVSAMKVMPRFNASLDKAGENLILKQYFHIGVAVDTPNGLVVPVIRDVDRKSLSELAKELEATSERARAKKLMPNDFQGASITISSLGGIGGTKFTPIINPPEVAVLGVSRARFQPVFKDGAFVPRLICPLSLSYDHRVIDGADAARFTTRLCGILSDIRTILL